MSDALRPGLSHVDRYLVTPDMSPPHLGDTIVLSTPKMVEFMEYASVHAVEASLRDDQTSVGTRVDVTHEAAAREGEEVAFESRLVEVDGRRLTFEVAATVGDRIIGRGRHQRFVIDRDRFRR